VDEVDDVRVADAIDEVAESAAEDEWKAPPEGALARGEPAVERDDERDGERRDEEKERAPHVLRRVLKQAPRSAPVLREHEIDVTLEELDGVKERIGCVEAAFCPKLRAEIRGERERGNDREEHVRGAVLRGGHDRSQVRSLARAPLCRRGRRY